MTCKGVFILTFVVVLSACQGEPRLVYVPSTEPEVELVVRASATEVSVGEPVVLYAKRRTGGEWKQVERKELANEQRWLSRPPPTQEPEVAGNLRWEVFPPASARFNTAFRADHTARSSSWKRGHSSLSPVPKSGVAPERWREDSRSRLWSETIRLVRKLVNRTANSSIDFTHNGVPALRSARVKRSTGKR